MRGLRRGVAQLVARLLWEQEVPGSNPGTPTKGNAHTTPSGGKRSFSTAASITFYLADRATSMGMVQCHAQMVDDDRLDTHSLVKPHTILLLFTQAWRVTLSFALKRQCALKFSVFNRVDVRNGDSELKSKESRAIL